MYGHECLGEQGADAWRYYLPDTEGHVRQGTDAAGEVVSAWLFDPDGTVVEGPEGPVSHLICGGVYDWSTGLIYQGGRYFDPALGIWLALLPLAVVQGGRKSRRQGVLLLCAALLAVGTLAGCGGGSRPTAPICTPVSPPPQCDTPLPPADTSLLAHTVTIQPDYVSRGITEDGKHSLGTVIGDGSKILTHNHYAMDLGSTRQLIITDHTKNHIEIVQQKDLNLRPIDAGTMIIELTNVNLETAMNCRVARQSTSPVNLCDPIQVVYYDDASYSLNVFSTHIVDGKAEEQGGPIVNYADPDFRINQGDSGGGVYKEGALAANMWFMLAIDSFDQDGNLLCRVPAGRAYAALLPARIN